MNRAQDSAGPFTEARIDRSFQEHSSPIAWVARRMAHQERVVVVVAEEHLRHDAIRQPRSEQLHRIDLTKNARQVAEPRIGRAQLRTRLFEYEQALERLDAEDDIRHA